MTKAGLRFPRSPKDAPLGPFSGFVRLKKRHRTLGFSTSPIPVTRRAISRCSHPEATSAASSRCGASQITNPCHVYAAAGQKTTEVPPADAPAKEEQGVPVLTQQGERRERSRTLPVAHAQVDTDQESDVEHQTQKNQEPRPKRP